MGKNGGLAPGDNYAGESDRLAPSRISASRGATRFLFRKPAAQKRAGKGPGKARGAGSRLGPGLGMGSE